MKQTFQYTGKSDSLKVQTSAGNVELKRDEPFTTDDARVARRLAEHPEIKAAGEKKEEEKKPSAKARDAQS
jgi:hypothetical protein